MKNLHLLVGYYRGLSKKGKILCVFAGIVFAIVVLEFLTGCTPLGKTWEF